MTNIVAYLPFLLVTGRVGEFLYSLPIVMTAALVASRIVSMTFVPLLGYYLLRPAKKPARSEEDRRSHGFYGAYYRITGQLIRRRWSFLPASTVFLALGLLMAWGLKTQFFPENVEYWSYVDVWLPNDVPLFLTNEKAEQAERIIRRVVSDYEKEHRSGTKGHSLLQSLTTFVGGGGPRF